MLMDGRRKNSGKKQRSHTKGRDKRKDYDVIIIGAGVCGAAIARELSMYKVKCCVVEKEEDVCCGASKANSGIIHAGYDAANGSLMARMNVEGNAMMEELAETLKIPFQRV